MENSGLLKLIKEQKVINGNGRKTEQHMIQKGLINLDSLVNETQKIERQRNRKRERNKKINERIQRLRDNNNGYIVREVVSTQEIAEVISLRSEMYKNNNIIELTNSHDPFDEYSRFFVVDKYDGERQFISAGLRVINRDNPIGFLPTEMNLMSKSKLDSFYDNIKNGVVSPNWVESTLNEKNKDNIGDFLKKYSSIENVFEVGGRFSVDRQDMESGKLLIGGIVEIIYKERWHAIIQTQDPLHLKAYEKTKYPYIRLDSDRQEIDGSKDTKIHGYIDSSGRRASTLALIQEPLKVHMEQGEGNEIVLHY